MTAPSEPLALEYAVDYEGTRVRIEWFDPPFLPPLEHTTQAYGICFTAEGHIVLVNDSSGWNLPGGGIEPGETLEETLAREVAEEACARVVACEYIGCQRVTPEGDRNRISLGFDPRAVGMTSYYQTRFWARVELDDWEPGFETTERALVSPDEFRETLWWGHAPTARIILEHGLRIQRARQGSIT